MNSIGVIEGFFGPQWPSEDRKSYAQFLSQYGGEFYIYAPKQDPYLRKKWRENWDDHYRFHLQNLVSHFHENGIKFGVGFSPFGLGSQLTSEDISLLKEKLSVLNDLEIDILGLFFDDMPVNENLAQSQIQALEIVRQNFKGQIVFCPSFYTPDPILDKVFGQRPEHYLEDIADGISQDVSIAWTGPKVISPEISPEHLAETARILKRRPFIWENLFANDGPKNCKFLKLKPFSGRNEETFKRSEAFGFNMMNQPQLSKILYLSSLNVLLHGMDPDDAFDKSLNQLCTESFRLFILKYKEKFLRIGLDGITDNEKNELIKQLESYTDKYAVEVIDWLQGKYNVGSECLTD
jgi:hyaluronoglucosaminidase